MKYPNVALIGKSGSGKSTVADYLNVYHCARYYRTAFAKRLKIEVGRQILNNRQELFIDDSDALAFVATNKAQLRSLLQAYGQTMRDVVSKDYWVRFVLEEVRLQNLFAARPVVVDDVRYMNEVEALKAAGFVIIRVIRPFNPNALPCEEANHESENDLNYYQADYDAMNIGKPEHVCKLVESYLESRRYVTV